jgi:hypothetical protein
MKASPVPGKLFICNIYLLTGSFNLYYSQGLYPSLEKVGSLLGNQLCVNPIPQGFGLK